MNTTKRSEKFRTKSGLFAVFCGRREGKNRRLWSIRNRFMAGQVYLWGKAVFMRSKSGRGEGKRQILPTLSRLTAVFRLISDPKCVSSDKKRSKSGRQKHDRFVGDQDMVTKKLFVLLFST